MIEVVENNSDKDFAKSQGAPSKKGRKVPSILTFPPNLGSDTESFGDGTSNIINFNILEFKTGKEMGYNAHAQKGEFTDLVHNPGKIIYHIYLGTPTDQKVQYKNTWEKEELHQELALGMDIFNSVSSGAMPNWGKIAASIGATAVREKFRNFLSDVSATTGNTILPYEEILFKQTGLRTFIFNFKLIPRNPSELQVIYDIIQLFKWASHPSLASKVPFISDPISTLGIRLLSYPNVFNIRYLIGGTETGEDNTWLHKHGPCVLQDISIDYSAGARNYVSYRSAKDFRFLPSNSGDSLDAEVEGAPIYYNLSLTFQEIIFLTKEAINVGY